MPKTAQSTQREYWPKWVAFPSKNTSSALVYEELHTLTNHTQRYMQMEGSKEISQAKVCLQMTKFSHDCRKRKAFPLNSEAMDQWQVSHTSRTISKHHRNPSQQQPAGHTVQSSSWCTNQAVGKRALEQLNEYKHPEAIVVYTKTYNSKAPHQLDFQNDVMAPHEKKLFASACLYQKELQKKKPSTYGWIF